MICMLMVQMVDDTLNNGIPEWEIFGLFNLICLSLPGMQAACRAQINEELPVIFEGLQQEPPEYQKLCARFDHCPSVPPKH